MKIGKLIGKGATAEVYEYEADKVIKLYNLGESEDSLLWEYNKLKEGCKSNVPCPRVFDLVDIDGRHGYIMERFKGITINEKMLNEIREVIAGNMTIESFSESFFNDIKGVAGALYELHKVTAAGWEKLDDRFIWQVNSTELLQAEEKETIISLIKRLPKDNAVCHCDTNPNNVIYCDGKYKFIDWVNAGIGNPLYDIAEYVLLSTPKKDINTEGVPQVIIDFYLKNKDLVVITFLNEYEKLSGRDISSYEPYIIPLLVSKLDSNRTDQKKGEIVLDIRNRLRKI